ncbi:uncharacterized protein [Oryctolagus cuniculus]|uniref:uncharacterized protein isoform X2 n=1 Tax=Oryctolagus cuniculus TaxID=9986 RepID=UPI00387A2246
MAKDIGTEILIAKSPWSLMLTFLPSVPQILRTEMGQCFKTTFLQPLSSEDMKGAINIPWDLTGEGPSSKYFMGNITFTHRSYLVGVMTAISQIRKRQRISVIQQRSYNTAPSKFVKCDAQGKRNKQGSYRSTAGHKDLSWQHKAHWQLRTQTHSQRPSSLGLSPVSITDNASYGGMQSAHRLKERCLEECTIALLQRAAPSESRASTSALRAQDVAEWDPLEKGTTDGIHTAPRDRRPCISVPSKPAKTVAPVEL